MNPTELKQNNEEQKVDYNDLKTLENLQKLEEIQSALIHAGQKVSCPKALRLLKKASKNVVALAKETMK
jgi:hypothetical protein